MESNCSRLFHPKEVEALQGMDVDQVVCGAEFTMARTVEGNLLAWGASDNGCLGTVVAMST